MSTSPGQADFIHTTSDNMRGFIVLLLSAVASTTAERNTLAPLFKPQNIIPDSYIVKFKDSVSANSFDNTVASFLDKSQHVYGAGAFKGFAATLNSAAVRELRRHPDVHLP